MIASKKMYFLMCVLVCTIVATSSADPDHRSLAVLYFENNSLSKKAEMEPLCKGLADMFITELSKIGAFQVIERAQLQQILEEMKLAQAGLISGESAQQVGQMLGAQNLLFGSYMNMLDGKMRIDVRIVAVETGVTIKAAEATGSPKDLYKLVAKLVIKIARDLNVQLSKADAQRLATVDNTSFDAALYFARGLEYEDANDAKKAAQMYQLALKKNPDFKRAKVRLAALHK